eukprot:830564-Prymnesium_polylepis.3
MRGLVIDGVVTAELPPTSHYPRVRSQQPDKLCVDISHKVGVIDDHDVNVFIAGLGVAIELHCSLESHVHERVAEASLPAADIAPVKVLESNYLPCLQGREWELLRQVLDDVGDEEAIDCVLHAQNHPHDVREPPIRLPLADERLGEHHCRTH